MIVMRKPLCSTGPKFYAKVADQGRANGLFPLLMVDGLARPLEVEFPSPNKTVRFLMRKPIFDASSLTVAPALA